MLQQEFFGMQMVVLLPGAWQGTIRGGGCAGTSPPPQGLWGMGLLTTALIQAWHPDDVGTRGAAEDSRSLVHLLLAIPARCVSQRGGSSTRPLHHGNVDMHLVGSVPLSHEARGRWWQPSAPGSL